MPQQQMPQNMNNSPVFILREGTEKESGKTAQSNNIKAALAVSEAVRTTLGPKGMDKMLVDSIGDVIITNDGVTILEELDVTHPAAKMIIETAQAQDQECYDGTTTSVILAGALLRYAEELIEQDVHPTIICEGFAKASQKAVELLEKESPKLEQSDRNEVLRQVAKTAMTGKSSSYSNEKLSEIAVEAINIIAMDDNSVDLDDLKVEKQRGQTTDETELIKGLLIEAQKLNDNMADHISNSNLAIFSKGIEVKKLENEAKFNIGNTAQYEEFINREEQELKEMVRNLKADGITAVFCGGSISDMAQHFLAKSEITAFHHIRENDLKKIARVTDAKIARDPRQYGVEDIGNFDNLAYEKRGNIKTVKIESEASNTRTILIRGATEHIVDELERNLHDALGVVSLALKEGTFNYGGGATAMWLSTELKDYGSHIGGREQLAINMFAKALEIVPKTLAENAGLDTIDTLINLRERYHRNNRIPFGVDAISQQITDMADLNVLEPVKVNLHAITAAADTAMMILRIDDVVASKKINQEMK